MRTKRRRQLNTRIPHEHPVSRRPYSLEGFETPNFINGSYVNPDDPKFIPYCEIRTYAKMEHFEAGRHGTVHSVRGLMRSELWISQDGASWSKLADLGAVTMRHTTDEPYG